MKVLLTGATGYLGVEVLAELLEHEIVTVVAWGRDRKRIEILRRRFASDAARLNLQVQDLLEPFPRTGDVDAIIHAAALRPPWIDEDPEAMGEVNLEATRRIAQLAVDTGCRRLVYVSSQSVYGTEGAPWTETAPLRPETPYARSKCEGEREILRTVPHEAVSILRLSRLYGVSPFVRWNELPGLFARAVSRGEPLSIHGSGDQRFDLIHVRDAAAAVVRTTLDTAGPAPRIVNVGGGRSISLNELCEAFTSLASDRGLPSVRVLRDPKHPAGRMRHLELDITTIQQELGWRPRVSLLEGLEGYLSAALEFAGPHGSEASQAPTRED